MSTHTSEGMGRRAMKSGAEYDVHTSWRQWYCWTHRPGATSKVKRFSRKRERREAKRAIRAAD